MSRRRHRHTARTVGAGLLGAGLLAGTWYGLRRPEVQRADVRVGDTLRRGGTPALDKAVVATTDLGSLYAVGAITGVLALRRRRRAALDVAAVGALAWAVAQHSKTRVLRARPYEADGVRRLIRPPTGSSYPSGHAAVGGAVMGVLAGHARSRAGGWVAHMIGAYVAATRVYVGVHYPTDVIGGLGLGLVLASAWRGGLGRLGLGALGLLGRARRGRRPELSGERPRCADAPAPPDADPAVPSRPCAARLRARSAG